MVGWTHQLSMSFAFEEGRIKNTVPGTTLACIMRHELSTFQHCSCSRLFIIFKLELVCVHQCFPYAHSFGTATNTWTSAFLLALSCIPQSSFTYSLKTKLWISIFHMKCCPATDTRLSEIILFDKWRKELELGDTEKLYSWSCIRICFFCIGCISSKTSCCCLSALCGFIEYFWA